MGDFTRIEATLRRSLHAEQPLCDGIDDDPSSKALAPPCFLPPAATAQRARQAGERMPVPPPRLQPLPPPSCIGKAEETAQ